MTVFDSGPDGTFRGCITAQQIANIKDKTADDDPSLLDGLSELPEEHQRKILKAMEVGHIADEDWRHVCVVHVCDVAID